MYVAVTKHLEILKIANYTNFSNPPPNGYKNSTAKSPKPLFNARAMSIVTYSWTHIELSILNTFLF